MQKIFGESGELRYIYQSELDKRCFHQDMANKKFKNLQGRTASGKYYVIKHLIMLKIKNMLDILLQWFVILL